MPFNRQRSLFEALGRSPLLEGQRWIEGVLLGDIAIGLCVLAIVFLGALMLTGKLPLREGMRVVLGCFVLLGAPVIAAGLMQSGSGMMTDSSPVPPAAEQGGDARVSLPPVEYDPYAGSSFGQSITPP